MRRTVKGALIIAGITILVGVILIGTSLLLGARPFQLINSGFFEEESWISLGSRGAMGYQDWENDFSDLGEYEVEADGIDSLDLKWISGEVSVHIYEGEQIKFSESSTQDILTEDALRYGMESGTLYIQYCERKAKSKLPQKNLDLYIPESLAKKLDSLNFDAVSASLTIDGINTTIFSFGSTSGSLKAEQMQSNNAKLDTSSGDLVYSGAYTDLEADTNSGQVVISSKGAPRKTYVRTTSGDVTLGGDCGSLIVDTVSGSIIGLDKVQAEDLELDTTSGDIDLSGVFSSVDVNTASGDVRLASHSCPDSADIETTSGDIYLLIPGDSSATIEYDTLSGEIRCDFSVVMSEDKLVIDTGMAEISLDTTSGDIFISQFIDNTADEQNSLPVNKEQVDKNVLSN